MYTRVLGLTISAVILANGAVGAAAQDRMMPQPVQQLAQAQPAGQEGSGMMGHGMTGGGMMGRGMMGGGMIGPPPVMLRIMFAVIDTDSDGTISLQEFQAAHERIFKAPPTKMTNLHWRKCRRSCTGPDNLAIVTVRDRLGR
jgi:hypothetical protein